RFHVAGEIPPFGPVLVVREMIPRKGYFVPGQGDSPSFIIHILCSRRSRGHSHGRAKGEAIHYSFHASILTASIMFRRAAWLAGNRLARTAAGNNQTGVHRSWSHGICKGIV